MKYIKHIFFFVIAVVLTPQAFTSWSLPWVDFIEREERGADESLKYWNSAKLQSAYDHPDYDTGRIAARGSLELLNEESVEEIIEKWEAVRMLLEQLPWYLPTVVTNFVENDNLLSWPHKYTSSKKSLTVHHTADGRLYRLPSDSLPWILEIYRQHTVAKQRWDIWYNFLIDPQGRIYEWRSWWEWVVAWHANLRNSITSLWIALIWNFENVRPTSAAMQSLKHLSTLLTYQYDIVPTSQVSLFDRVTETPYIQAHTHDEAILWHKDIKSTACPGEYLYSKIPWLIEEISGRLKRLDGNVWSRKLVESDFVTLPRAVWSDDHVAWIIIPWNETVSQVTCESFSSKTTLVDCVPVMWWVRLQISYQPDSTWHHTVWVVTDRGAKMISFSVVREQDIRNEVTQRKAWFEISPPSSNQKITDYILRNKAQEYLNEDINILLYEPTNSWEATLKCNEWCEVAVDDVIISNAQIIIIRQEWDKIVGFIDLVRYDTDQIIVRDPLWWNVQITNFERYSWAVALNVYKGELLFQIQAWRDLDEWMRDSFTVVNTLPFRDYIQWMGESSEAQHFEKTKALALLTKTYALFYRSWNNPHPSIPSGVSYTAIDDPRSFQRYLWAWIESSSPVWLQAVDATYYTLVLYEWFVPILPYYHCSAWFSRSWQEKFWRTDTPWLSSKKDFVSCESEQFEWHGVGMSGDWAEYLAQVWASAEDILQWWYEWVEMIEL